MLAAIGVIATAIGAIVAAVLGYKNKKKLTEIHILVNSRLDQALSEINDLKSQRDLKRKDDKDAV
jgi:hypothetical protein